jgi:hypothetical protein
MKSDFIDTLEYDESAPDVEAIMSQIRGYLAEHLEVRAGGTAGGRRARVLDQDVYNELQQAEAELNALHIMPYVTPSRIPLIGGLLNEVRLAFHRLVVYYVDRLAGAQTHFNTHTVRMLRGVVTGIDQDDASGRILRLEANIQVLEARLAALEAIEMRPAPGDDPRG